MHSCSHDTFDYSNILPSNFFTQYSNNYQNQQFQSNTAQPIRVTYDFSLIPNKYKGVPSSFLQSQLDNLALYMQYFIKVVPRSTPIKNTSGRVNCNNFTYPLSFTTNGIDNSDFHIFVTSIDSGSTKGAPAQAWWCEVDPNPVVAVFQLDYGIIQYYYPTDYLSMYIFKSLIHQFIHVLGFSHNLFPFWIDQSIKQPYGNNISKLLSESYSFGGSNAHLLKSFNLKYFVNNFYDCSNSEGMILENQPKVANKISHFELDIVGNDLMAENTFIYLQISLTQMTAFLLRDTGFYDTVNENLLELSQNQWGKTKYCGFIQDSCRSTGTKYSEFIQGIQGDGDDDDDDESIQCDFYQIGFTTTQKITNSQCKIAELDVSDLCSSTTSKPPSQINRMNTGTNSRCFRSNAYQTSGGSVTTKVKCFKSVCDASSSTIQVTIWGTETVSCNYQNQVIDLSSNGQGTSGKLTCPSNFQLFCSTFQYLVCSKNCNSNGFCNKGICFCQKGYAGTDCSVQCSSGQVYDNSQCVDKCGTGKYANPNNTCFATCPPGFFGDQTSQKCLLCHPFCSQCTGPSQTECQKCNFPYIYNSGTSTCTDRKCDTSCSTCYGLGQNNCLKCFKGYFLDSNDSCQPCSPQCSECEGSSSQCTTCPNTPNLFLAYDSKTKQCVSTCDKSCSTCTQPSSPSSCLDCQQGYKLNGASNCVLICDSSCLTCSQSNSSNSCTSCNPGYFLSNQNTCLQCQSPCLECKNSQSECTKCVQNYALDSQTNTCLKNCDQACEACLVPEDPTQCSSCAANYFSLQSSQPFTCIKCIQPCISCQQNGQCLKCDVGYELVGNQCQIICHASCQTCTQPLNSQACSSCPDNFYLSGTKCLQCQSPCQNCVNSANNCTSCVQNYQLQNNQCIFGCYKSCLECQQLNDENSCLTCQPGYFFAQNNSTQLTGQCTPCQANCQKCGIKDNSSQKQTCLQCMDGYQFDIQGVCTQCDSTCKSCFVPNNPQACESCFSSFNLTSNSECIKCDQGYYFSQQNQQCLLCPDGCMTCSSNQVCNSCAKGYTLDSNNNCVNSIQCHYSCKSCVNSSYQACLTCSSNRELKIADKETQTGICDCPTGTTDNGVANCENSNVQEIVTKTSQLSFSVSASVISVSLMMEFCQSISYLSYVNYKPAMGLDGIFNQISFINLSKVKIINDIFGSEESDSQNDKRLLDSNSDQQDSENQSIPDDNSVKFQLNDKSSQFLANSILIVGINFIIWILAALFSLIKIQRYNNYLLKARKIFCISAPIAIFFFSSQEYSLLMFLQLKSPQYETKQQIMSLSFALASVVYIFGFLFYITYQLHTNRKTKYIKQYGSDVENNKSFRHEHFSLKRAKELSNQSSKQNFSLYDAHTKANISTQKIVYLRPSQLDLVKNQSIQYESTEEKSQSSKQKSSPIKNAQIPYYKIRLYIIYKYVKQDTVLSRNFVQLTIIRKLIISLCCVMITQNPIVQLSLQLANYVIFCVYILIVKPLKYPQQMLSMCIVDSIIAILHIMYIIMVSYSDNEFLQKLMSLLILSTTISVFVLFFIYSLVILIKLFYLQLQKCIYRNYIIKDKKDLKPLDELNNIFNEKKDDTFQQIIHQDNTDQVKSPTLIKNFSKFNSPKESPRDLNKQ